MQTLQYDALKINTQNATKIQDFLVVEAPLQININNQPYTVVMRTPNNDVDLIRGLLYAEDIYKDSTNISTEIINEKEDFSTVINVTIPKDKLRKGYLNKRTLLSVSSCGICGKKELKDLEAEGEKLQQKLNFTSKSIHQMFAKMISFQQTFEKSGGSHGAAIFNKEQKLLTLQEDIGRHNAVDKSVGKLLEQNQLKHAHYLLVSGRVSYEIVSKAFIAKIPVIIAISACSSLAVDFAKEFGICLIGFTRADKMTVYANPNSLNI